MHILVVTSFVVTSFTALFPVSENQILTYSCRYPYTYIYLSTRTISMSLFGPYVELRFTSSCDSLRISLSQHVSYMLYVGVSICPGSQSQQICISSGFTTKLTLGIIRPLLLRSTTILLLRIL